MIITNISDNTIAIIVRKIRVTYTFSKIVKNQKNVAPINHSHMSYSGKFP